MKSKDEPFDITKSVLPKWLLEEGYLIGFYGEITSYKEILGLEEYCKSQGEDVFMAI